MLCSRTQQGLTRVGLEPPTSGSGVRGINNQATALLANIEAVNNTDADPTAWSHRPVCIFVVHTSISSQIWRLYYTTVKENIPI